MNDEEKLCFSKGGNLCCKKQYKSWWWFVIEKPALCPGELERNYKKE